MKVDIKATPEVLIKDIIEGYMKGNHTMREMFEMMETVARDTKMKVEG